MPALDADILTSKDSHSSGGPHPAMPELDAVGDVNMGVDSGGAHPAMPELDADMPKLDADILTAVRALGRYPGPRRSSPFSCSWSSSSSP